jgi:UPF0176 protein
MAHEVIVSSFYKFLSLSEEQLAEIRSRLETFCSEHGVRGLAVIGKEGVNSTVAATCEKMELFKGFLAELLKVSDIEFKDSTCEKMPFARFKVDLRPEIITTKDDSVYMALSEGTYLSPAEWHKVMEEESDFLLIDTRNFYETGVGIFEGAVDPKITKFSDFKKYVEENPLPKDKKLLLYCTGGIRCEKAVPEVKQLGYENVYQLHGGILRYLEEFPNGHFKGECFVFDHRVALDQNLQPSKTYKLCPHCGNPAKEIISCGKCESSATVCSKCLESPEKHTCSKNCAYHLKRSFERESVAA